MKNIFHVALWLSCSFCLVLPAQVTFQKRYGADSKEFEKFRSGLPAPDGGLLVGGYTESGAQGEYDMFVQKLNPDGTEAWFKTYGGPDLDVFSTMVPAAGGGYLLTGYTVDAVDGSFDAVLAKIDENGALLWWKTYGNEGLEVGLGLCQTTNGTIVVVGSTLNSIYQPALFRAVFDQNGAFITDYLTQTDDDIADARVLATSDGGYLAEIRGGNIIFGALDALIKYNSGHGMQWSNTPAAIGAQVGLTTETINDLKASANGLLACFSTGNGPILLYLSNSTGNALWQKKITASFAFSAGLQAFPDGSIGVAVVSASLMIKKLSGTGVTLDSVSLTTPSQTGFYPDFVFQDIQHLYLVADVTSNNQNNYASALVTTTGGPMLAWQQTFGENGPPDHDSGDAIASLPDGGFVLAGSKEDASGRGDLWLFKANAQGDILWEKTIVIGASISDDAVAGAIKLDPAGNIIVLAATDYSMPEYHLLKLAPSGDLLFDKVLVASDYVSDFFRVVPLVNGDFAVCLTLFTPAFEEKPTLIRLHSSGNVLWSRNYDGNSANDLLELPNGHLLVAGSKNDSPWLFQTDAGGNLEWEKTYDGNGYGFFSAIRLSVQGDLFLAGASANVDETEIRALVIKANTAGDVTWRSEFSKGNPGYWQASAVMPDGNGGACFLGQYLAPPVNRDLFSSILRLRLNIAQVDAAGNLVSDQSFGNDGTYPYGNGADLSTNGTIVFCSTLSSGTALQDAWVVKADCTVGVQELSRSLEGVFELVPNPAVAGGHASLVIHGSIAQNLEVTCLDLQGKQLWQRKIQTDGGEGRFDFSMPQIPGAYMLRMADESGAFKTLQVVAH